MDLAWKSEGPLATASSISRCSDIGETASTSSWTHNKQYSSNNKTNTLYFNSRIPSSRDLPQCLEQIHSLSERQQIQALSHCLDVIPTGGIAASVKAHKAASKWGNGGAASRISWQGRKLIWVWEMLDGGLPCLNIYWCTWEENNLWLIWWWKSEGSKATALRQRSRRSSFPF